MERSLAPGNMAISLDNTAIVSYQPDPFRNGAN